MKRILMVTIAASAFAFSALAMNQQQSGMSHDISSDSPAVARQRNTFSPVLVTREVVTRIQQALNEKGFNAGQADGVWGPRTVAAIENFQRTNNLKADGQLDDRTMAALGLPNRQPGAGGADTQGSQGSGDGAMSNGIEHPGGTMKTDEMKATDADSGSPNPAINANGAIRKPDGDDIPH